MIKFFRKIKQNLLSEGKTGKYMKCTIGEIILVVIGILIALQINNWNEGRIKKQNLTNIYSIASSDLQKSIKDAESVIASMEEKEEYYLKILNGQMKISDYKNCGNCYKLIAGAPHFNLELNGFDLLKKPCNK